MVIILNSLLVRLVLDYCLDFFFKKSCWFMYYDHLYPHIFCLHRSLLANCCIVLITQNTQFSKCFQISILKFVRKNILNLHIDVTYTFSQLHVHFFAHIKRFRRFYVFSHRNFVKYWSPYLKTEFFFIK